ncbi:hypothetical protein S7711_11583 [Stachybotrys chartarum IBT 7711]|uniref:Uncharacterized protein n=1 Tax=Stachybotrys chartarum (strain CBS 109288 / IBT 7711) TaxID=1280523 RepID=A0A084AF25_STACB|nr:hypothetical protein S7711_11583 [Stachybotrys chartarum IBT 7711]KFA70974.1 hypothetical protein S40288_11746 [Stachybotrys chartarum IBT 40288]
MANASSDESSQGEDDIQSSLGLSNVDLLAMVLSDSGLANAEPQWWNASPLGCFLIGLQPRGGWQVSSNVIMQRTMQWGDDAWARCFGVGCPPPTLYAYFACSIRNRLEVWASDNFRSPMEGMPPGSPWRATSEFTVKRPTKLIDGSRGGQAFMAEILTPEANKQYSIGDQSRMQLLSVLLVGASLAHGDMVDDYLEVVLAEDFNLSPGLGTVFSRLATGLILCSLICIALLVSTWWSLLRTNLYSSRSALAWITKVVSLGCWAVGATGLLMLGGNPRVKLVTKQMDDSTRERLRRLVEEAEGEKMERDTTLTDADEVVAVMNLPTPITEEEQNQGSIAEPQHKKSEIIVLDEAMPIKGTDKAFHQKPSQTFIQRTRAQTLITVQFGSLHGSVFTPDRGSCVLPLSLVERICTLDIKMVRSWGWMLGVIWFGLMLLAGVTLQIGGTLAPSFPADLASLTFLLLTSLARGAGVSGPEEWMIPKWKRRANAENGAILLGQYNARAFVAA